MGSMGSDSDLDDLAQSFTDDSDSLTGSDSDEYDQSDSEEDELRNQAANMMSESDSDDDQWKPPKH